MLYKVPTTWCATPHQAKLIETLVEFPGRYVSAEDLIKWIYNEEIDYDAPAPAKLRVLIQRARAVLADKTADTVSIAIKRNKGYRITKSHTRILLEMS